ncbi:type I iodothyronine deiodinase-like [Ptychodera flava]|uniref:type I iodothyronine deiodinase-like n=1 Tax=Ptychodera flava TaxID=63121 RepID=UPI00396A2EE4
MPRLPCVGRDLFEKRAENAILDGGSLSKLLADYKSKVDFLFVYLTEAHPRDGFKMGRNFSFMKQHRSIEDRIQCARELISKDGDTFTSDLRSEDKVRVVVDTMENDFNETFCAHPDRAYIVENGKMAYIGATMIETLKTPQVLTTDHLRDWLESRFQY